MDDCLRGWKSDFGAEFPAPLQRRPPGFENELVELLWQNGEIVMQSQNTRKQKQDDETASWMDCPIDESFEREFCANFLSEIPSFDESDKKLDSKRGPDFATAEVKHVVSSSQLQDFASSRLPPPPPGEVKHVVSSSQLQDFASSRLPPPPPPRFRAADTAVKKQACSRVEHECSGTTVGSSHCASNHVVNEVDMSWASSSGMGSRTVSAVAREEAYARKMNEHAVTSCSGGSGSSSLWKTSRHKRKSQNMEESECPSDATELESAAGTKASQKSGSRVAEVHNLSERRRRDRINEKMRALQELIPHANKSDKASMLDEAIEYMKSLQLQIQLMWMGRGMVPMMLPGMQHYMPRVGMGIGPTMLPAIQNLMRLSRLPLVNQAMNMPQAPNQAQVGHNPMLNLVNYPNSSFQEQYANYMSFHSMQNASPQAMNMFEFGLHSGKQNRASAPYSNGNKSTG